MKNSNEIIDIAPLKSGRWLVLNEITYLNKQGKKCLWEAVGRKNENGAVVIIPVFKHSKDFLLIKQFRVPLAGYVYEFPAGLIDVGHTPEETAMKELYEETGYTGNLIELLPACFSSPGMTTESVYTAIVEIDENLTENKNPVQHLEESEDIVIERVPIAKLADFLFKDNKEVNIDAKLAAFVLGLTFSNKNIK